MILWTTKITKNLMKSYVVSYLRVQYNIFNFFFLIDSKNERHPAETLIDYRRQFLKLPTSTFVNFFTEYPRLFDFEGDMVRFFNEIKN